MGMSGQLVLLIEMKVMDALTALVIEFGKDSMDKGGIYYGENAISHNLIMCNKANLLNQSAFLLGVPGSGKSFSANFHA